MAALDPASPRPLYAQLAAYLRQQIESGVWQRNSRLPPEIELAAQFEVSRGTVRQAMDLLVKQGLLQRIPGKGTFVTLPDTHARSQLIGIVVPYLRDSLTTDMLRGAESVLRRSGYSLIFCHSEGDLQLEQAQIEQLQREGVGGLIVFPVAAAGESTLLRQALQPRLPLVIIDRRLPHLSAYHVLADNIGGAYRAVEHLLAQGHSRIACISLPERPSSIEERIRGYEQALRDAGILPLAAVALALGKHAAGDSVPRYTAEELAPIDQLLAVRERPTALFCVNDFIALGVMQHVLARGLRVPQDLAIVGFDDIALAPYMPVPLTTVAQPKYEIGARAAQLLLDQIAGVAPADREIVLPTDLVVRASTGLPAATTAEAPTVVAQPQR
ncbi:MAG TPA: GntR family transcriptional regulator [Herpetosiphonaceae bacterium]